MTLLTSVRDYFSQLRLSHPKIKSCWIAYSGGVDSRVLLDICHRLRSELSFDLRAVHINHGLSSNSAAWAADAHVVCSEYAISCDVHTIQLNPKAGASLEEEARNKRYEILAEILQEGDLLLTAHHQDDQAETLLLQLLRGAGPKGLSSMPRIKSFSRGFHARPFLSYSRALIQEYANEHKLSWVEDESNTNYKFSRNFIRHEIMPLLKTRWPSAAAAISRSAQHCSEAQGLLEEIALESGKNMNGSCENSLSVSKLIVLTPERQRLILRTWIEGQGYPLPDTNKIIAIQKDVLTAAWDRLPCVSWQGTDLRRYRDDLFLMPGLPEHDEKQTHHWDLATPLTLPGIGLLRADKVPGLGLRGDIDQVSVRFRQGGETIDIPGRGRHTLKNLFQEWNVLPWLRDRLPLIYIEEELAGVVGHYIGADYVTESEEMGWNLTLL